MKNILLLGDSIRQNYQEYVEQELKDRANVYYTRDNGRFCAFTLRYLHEWVKALSYSGEIMFDIVHFNCGLWDILRLSGEEEPFTSEEQYRILLQRIVKRIRFLCPGAKIIFALTTAVTGHGFEEGISVGERRNADIIKYNEIAKELFKNTDVDIDDLWSVSKRIPSTGRSDSVHFETELGSRMLGESVVFSLSRYC